jgi:hypothetical protein
MIALPLTDGRQGPSKKIDLLHDHDGGPSVEIGSGSRNRKSLSKSPPDRRRGICM